MTDCLYGSARIRALENGIVGGEKIRRLVAAENTDGVIACLREFGFPVADGKSAEENLSARLQAAYGEVETLLPGAIASAMWKYPYDCNNLKAIIKCNFRAISPDSMLFDFGSVSTHALKQMVQTKNFDGLPSEMQKAATLATEEFAKTKNPQVVDLILDGACYRDLLHAAIESKNAFLTDLVRKKIDLVNTVTFVRVLRMKSGEAGRMFLKETFLAGGTLEESFFDDLYGAGEANFWERMAFTDFATFAEGLSPHASLTAVEKAADDAWMESIRAAKFIPYGVEVLVAYLLAVEYEVRNIRIVIAGKNAGLPKNVIEERIRNSYV